MKTNTQDHIISIGQSVHGKKIGRNDSKLQPILRRFQAFFFSLYFSVVVFLNYNEQEYLLKSEKKPSKYYFCKRTRYRNMICQVVGQLLGKTLGDLMFTDWAELYFLTGGLE